MNLPRPATAVRWALGVCSVGYGLFLGSRLLTGEGVPMPSIVRLMLTLALCCLGGVLISPELVGWVTSPFQQMFDAIFLPSESAPKPPADFTLARHYVRQARYEEACEEYEKIIRYHPAQLAAYLEGIQAAAQTGDEARAERFHRNARRAVRTDDQRALLESVYAARGEPLLPAIDAGESETLDAAGPETLDAEEPEKQGPAS